MGRGLGSSPISAQSGHFSWLQVGHVVPHMTPLFSRQSRQHLHQAMMYSIPQTYQDDEFPAPWKEGRPEVMRTDSQEPQSMPVSP